MDVSDAKWITLKTLNMTSQTWLRIIFLTQRRIPLVQNHSQNTRKSDLLSQEARCLPLNANKQNQLKFFRIDLSIVEIEDQFVRDFELSGTHLYPYLDKLNPPVFRTLAILNDTL